MNKILSFVIALGVFWSVAKVNAVPNLPDVSYPLPAQLILDKKLVEAVVIEDAHAVAQLLKKGARINHPISEKDNHTAVTAALASGFVDIAEQLLVHDADSLLSARAYFYAVRAGDLNMLKVIESRLSDEKQQPYRYLSTCTIQEAIKHGRLSVIQYLYPKEKAQCGGLIEAAIKHEQIDIISWLLEQEPEAIKQANNYVKRKMLKNAVTRDSVPMIELLLEHGFTLQDFVEDQSESGMFDFGGFGFQRDWFFNHSATFKSKLAVLKYLQSKGLLGLMPSYRERQELLTAAISHDHIEGIHYLEQLGIRCQNDQALDHTCSDRLRHSIENGAEQSFRYFLKKVPDIAQFKVLDTGNNLLHLAVSNDVLIEDLLNYSNEHQLGWHTQANLEGNTPLHIAVKFGSVNTVRKLLLLAKYDDLHELHNKQGQTVLHIALDHMAYQHSNQMLDVLLSHDPKLLNVQDNEGTTPLMLAAKNKPTSVRGLLQRGAALHLQDHKGRYALHYFMDSLNDLNIQDNADLLERLIVQGGNLNLPDQQGQTALHHAVRLLYERGASDQWLDRLLTFKPDLNVQDESGKTPLLWAVEHRREAFVVSLLKQGADLSIRDQTGRTALDYAKEYHYSTLIEKIASIKPDTVLAFENDSLTKPKAKPEESDLHLAVRSRLVSNVDAVLKTKPNVNRPNYFGTTALQLAIAINERELFDRLLKAGANIHTKDRDWRTPLHTAIAHQRFDIATVLLEQRSDPNARSRGAWTPLHFAAQQGQIELIELLLKQGADPSAINWGGKTPEQIALDNQHDSAAALLKNASIPKPITETDEYYNHPLHHAVFRLDLPAVRDWLKQVPDAVNQLNIYYETPLTLALQQMHSQPEVALPIVNVLMEQAANPDEENRQAETQLQFAIREGLPSEVILALLPKASIEVADANGDALIEQAVKKSELAVVQALIAKQKSLLQHSNASKWSLLQLAIFHERSDLTPWLIEQGADVNHKNADGATPLLYAVILNDVITAQALINANVDFQAAHRNGSLLKIAVENRQLKLVALLLQQPSLVHKQDEFREIVPALFAMVEHGDIFADLLDQFIVEHDLQAIVQRERSLLNKALLMDAVQTVQVLQKHALKALPDEFYLHQAALNGAEQVVPYLLEQGASIQDVDKLGNTVLHLAAASGNQSLIKWLSQQSVNPNIRNQHQQTVLDVALTSLKDGAFDDIDFFLTTFPQADISPASLHYLVNQNQYLNINHLLASRDLSPQIKANDQNKTLFMALLQRLESYVQLQDQQQQARLALFDRLLSDDLTQANNQLANLVAHPEFARLLLKKDYQWSSLEEHWEVLKAVVEYRDKDSIELLNALLEHGLKVKQARSTTIDRGSIMQYMIQQGFYAYDAEQEQTFMHKYQRLLTQFDQQDLLNTSNGYPDLLQLLMSHKEILERMPDIFLMTLDKIDTDYQFRFDDLRDYFVLKHPVLANALFTKFPSIAKQFQAHGLLYVIDVTDDIHTLKALMQALPSMDTQAKDRFGRNALHLWMDKGVCTYAWEEDEQQCLLGLQYLQEQGVSLHETDAAGNNLLHDAISDYRVHLPLLKYLLEQGVNPNLLTQKDGLAAMHLAMRNADKATALAMVKLLVDAGADVNQASAKGDTPLVEAMTNNNAAMVEHLLSADQLSNVANQWGETPLHYLAKQSRPDWMKTFLQKLKPAQAALAVKQQDHAGNTPLHWLGLQACGQCDAQKEMVDLLLQYGADLDLKNQYGETALFFSVYNSNLSLAQHLWQQQQVLPGLNTIGNNMLHIAFYRQDWKMLDWLIEQKMDLNQADWMGVSTLAYINQQQRAGLALLAQQQQYDGLVWTGQMQQLIKQAHWFYHVLSEQRKQLAVIVQNYQPQHMYRDPKHNNTLVHIAAKANADQVLDVLVRVWKHPIDWQNLDQDTPLHLALANGATTTARYLLAQGADPNAANQQGITPFHLAVRNNHLALAKQMLENGADLETADNEGLTALLHSMETGSLAMTAWLLQSKANIHARSKQQHTPLIHSVWYYVTQAPAGNAAELERRIQLIDLLLANGATLGDQDALKRTVLHIGMPIYELAQHLLAKGADPSIKNDLDESPFFQAIRAYYPDSHKSEQLIRGLVAAGADVNEINQQQETPVSVALHRGRRELLPLLVELDADVNQLIRGKPLIMHVLSRRYYFSDHTRDFLLDLKHHGVNFAAQDERGNSALHQALLGGHFELSQFLIEQVDDVNQQNNNGKSILHIAVTSSLQPSQQRSIIALIHAKGGDLQQRDHRGRTLLHYAVAHSHQELVEWLLDKGIDMNVQDVSDQTALHIAIENNNRPLAKHLLEQGANPNITAFGDTALHRAAKAGHLPMMKLLESYQADTSIRNYDRKLAVELLPKDMIGNSVHGEHK